MEDLIAERYRGQPGAEERLLVSLRQGSQGRWGSGAMPVQREGMVGDEEALAALAKVWHYHVAKFRVEEEENRFRFVLDPCGSGGRLYRGEMHLDSFHYGDTLSPLVKGKHNIAFNREDAPHYCTHCASSNRDMFLGAPLVFVVDGTAQSRPGAPCHQYLWKREAPREVEPRLLEQVGMSELLPLKQID